MEQSWEVVGYSYKRKFNMKTSIVNIWNNFTLCLLGVVLLLISSLNSTSSSEVHHPTSFNLESKTLSIDHTSNSPTMQLEKLDDDLENLDQETNSSDSKKRSKRFISYNLDGSLQVGFLISIPIAIILPSMTNLFNKWRRRRSVEDEDENLTTYEDSPAVQPHLNKITTYFELMQIPEQLCQLRAICEFSAHPEKYFPVSDMIISRIRDPNLPPMLYLENEDDPFYSFSKHKDAKCKNSTTNSDDNSKPQSLFKIYNKAVDRGQAFGQSSCQETYGKKCKYSMDKLLNLPVLRFWNALSSVLKIQFTDTE